MCFSSLTTNQVTTRLIFFQSQYKFSAMKNSNILTAVLVALISVFAFSAFDKPEVKHVELTNFIDEDGNVITRDDSGVIYTGDAAAGASNLQRIYALDTLTTAGTYTTVLPYNLSSPYQYQYFLQMKKIGVTPNLKVVLDERNTSNSTLWSAIDSFSMSGADSTKLNFRLRGSIAYGAAHRLRYVKTGAGAISRKLEVNIKGTN